MLVFELKFMLSQYTRIYLAKFISLREPDMVFFCKNQTNLIASWKHFWHQLANRFEVGRQSRLTKLRTFAA